MKFKTKPAFIEANQFDGTFECMEQLKKIFRTDANKLILEEIGI